jgi:protein-L-isoaspartate(D-aspartate) O-methyltransferase
MVLARLLQMALPQPGERALVLCAGPGYGAAVLARMGLQVLAIEAEPALVAAARHAVAFGLEANRPEITGADPRLGAPQGAPYRLILIEGAVEAVPPALFSQLGEGGRLVTIRRAAGQVGRAVLFRRAGGAVSEIEGLDAAGPLLPAFTRAPGFVL